MKTGDLFAHAPSAQKLTSRTEDRVTLACHRLAVEFTEEVQLPVRYRKRGDSVRKPREPKRDSEIEKRFTVTVQAWRSLIETMLAKLDHDQAWRFIDLSPQVGGSIKTIADNRDFCAFINYLILRRDKEECDPDELGGLAQLSVAFQREVEKRIETT
jgi:hypothetical protein